MKRIGIKNLLVTGGSGKIGKSALPELVEAGYRIRAIQLPGEPVTADGVEVMEGSLADPTLAARAIQDMDGVLHLANVKENRELFMAVNVQGTFSLLDAAKNSGHVKQFIQAGSDARAGIYFYPHPVPITEGHPHRAYPGYYAFSKVLEEVMCEQFRIQYGLPISVLRFSWVYDEDDVLAHVTMREPNFGVPVWEEVAETPEQKAYFTPGCTDDGVACMRHPDGQPCIRHVVGIKDAVQSIMLAVDNPAAVGEAFNVCAPGPFSYDVMADYVSEKLGIPVVDFVNPIAHDFSIDPSKSRQVLGYKPEYDIFRIVDDAIAFRQAGKTRTPLLYPG